MEKTSKGQIQYFNVSIMGLTEEVELKDVLKIGKIGQDLNCNHPQISLRHCTLYFADGILSIKDHMSDHGVSISGEKIPSDKMIIVMEDDQVKLGDLILGIKPVYGELFDEVIDKIENITPDAPPPLPSFLDDDTSDFVPFPLNSPKFEAVEDISISKLRKSEKIVNLSQLRDGDIKKEDDDLSEVIFTEGSFLDNPKVVESSTMTQVSMGEVDEVDDLEDAFDESVDDGVQEYTQVNLVNNKVKKAQSTKSKSDFGIILPVRIVSFLIDLNLVFILSSLIISSKFYQNFFLSPASSILGTLGFNLNYSGLLAHVFIFYFLRIIGNLIFKKSFGQFVSLIAVEKVSKARLRAFGRSLLSFIIFPICFFLDCPAIVSKPTIKEVLFNSRFFSRSHFLSFLFSIIGFIVTGYFAFLLPMGKRHKNITEFSSKVEKINSNTYINQKINSSYFHFEKAFKKKSFLAYPFFKIKKEKGKKTFSPIMQIYSVNDKSFINFQNLESFSWLEVFKKFDLLNPLFAFQFPTLYKAYQEESVNKKKYSTELMNFIQAISSFETANSIGHILNYGPFSKSYRYIHNYIEKFVGGKLKSIKFYEIDKNQMISMSVIPQKFATDKSITHLWGTSLNKSLRLKFSSDSVIDLNKFQKNFFEGLKWHNRKFTGLSQKVDPYQIIDYFSKYDRDLMSMGDLERIYKYYFNLGKWLTKSENKKHIKADFLSKAESMLGLVVSLNVVARREKESDSNYHPLEETIFEGFIKNFNLLLEAIKTNDQSFFRPGAI